MKEKKYIDRLYQEKFRDLEVVPREAVWKSIAAKLQEDEKKPVAVPLWSKLAGVAAILAFMLLIGDWLMPKEFGAAIANEETEAPVEPSSRRLQNNIPQTAPPVNINSNIEVAAVTEADVLPTESPLQVVREEKRSREVSALAMSSRNAIFETQSPIASSDLLMQKESDLPQQMDELLMELLKEEETEIAEATTKKGFEISTHAAPIYYGNMGKGNFIDKRFNNNSSESEVTYSYGINVAYHLNEKIKIRSGLNKVNMSYNTGGVAYQAVAGTSPLKSISLQPGTSVTGTTGNKTTGRPTGSTNRTEVGFLRPGELNQKLGYLEIPLELEYNLFASKFELNLIGGASTLFLSENEIFLNSGSVSMEGRSNNLNNISFSTNIGLGLDYKISEKFRLNFEPMFKYQLNTFETSSSETRPYYFGVYSGFSYKF